MKNDPENNFFGYDPEAENRRAIEESAIPFTITYSDYQAPEQIDPRKMVRHDDQGNMGSCGGHGNSNCGEYLWCVSENATEFSDKKQFSRLYCYLEAQRLDGLLGRDNGSTIESGLKVAKTGYLEESLLPYRTPYSSAFRSIVTDDMRQKAIAFRVNSHSWLKTYQAIFDYLASGQGGVYVGSVWNNSFYGQNHVVERLSMANGGGHAYAFLGYSTRKDNAGRNYIWRKNSHANDNWTEISPYAIDQMCNHQWTSIVGMTDLTTPKPRPIDFTKQSVFG